MNDTVAQERALAGLRYRPSVRELEKDKNKLNRFVEAWRQMAEKPVGDESSFQHIAGIHGEPAPHFCDHSVRFFPWHRAYLLKLERALMKIDPTVSLPWFDFASPESQASGLPTSFRPTAQGGFDDLAHQPIGADGGRDSVRDVSPPSGLPTQQVVDTALKERNYVSFWRAYYPTIHNALHGWIGGDASTSSYTAFDPSFWIIHCANDRHWWLWQLLNQGSNPPRLDEPLPGLDMTARAVLDINALGYEYASSEIDIIPEV